MDLHWLYQSVVNIAKLCCEICVFFIGVFLLITLLNRPRTESLSYYRSSVYHLFLVNFCGVAHKEIDHSALCRVFTQSRC